MFKESIKGYFQSFWNKSINYQSLNVAQKLLFSILRSIEPFYIYSFSFAQNHARNKTPYTPSMKIISVGNISMGGTGKSVFTAFLIESLKSLNGAVILRGYGGSNENSGRSRIINEQDRILFNINFTGDESYMLAATLHVPVVIGKDRISSCKLLERANELEVAEKKISYVVLDDAYQNRLIKKDIEILLLDARHPFENGHCFPAGKLREKDISRADTIILTHADKLSGQELFDTVNHLSKTFNQDRIFSGKHQLKGFFAQGKRKIDSRFFAHKKIIAFAGIGAFSSFAQSIEESKIKVMDFYEFPDHYQYTSKDIEFLIAQHEQDEVDCFITTRKDWYKISEFLHNEEQFDTLPFYVLDIEFAFLSPQEHNSFFEYLTKQGLF